jgi:hypothetical protein
MTGNFFEIYCHELIPLGGPFDIRLLFITKKSALKSDTSDTSAKLPFFDSWVEKDKVYKAILPKLVRDKFDANPPVGSSSLKPVEGHYLFFLK